MRQRLERVRVVTALLALSASWAAGWAVAFHLATDDHHARGRPVRGSVRELEIATHGHLHSDGTPAHSHPLVGSVAARVTTRLSLLAPATCGNAPQAALADALRRRMPSRAGPNHDPPARGGSVSILRI